MKTHLLKTDPKPFQDVWDSVKSFEIRKDDRDFEVGDRIILQETTHTGQEMKSGAQLAYTKREISCLIAHIMRGPIYGLANGWVIMSIN